MSMCSYGVQAASQAGDLYLDPLVGNFYLFYLVMGERRLLYII